VINIKTDYSQQIQDDIKTMSHLYNNQATEKLQQDKVSVKMYVYVCVPICGECMYIHCIQITLHKLRQNSWTIKTKYLTIRHKMKMIPVMAKINQTSLDTNSKYAPVVLIINGKTQAFISIEVGLME